MSQDNSNASLRSFVFDSARNAASLEKKTQERETTPQMKETGDFANTPFRGRGDFEREEPPKDHMRRYWRQYETTPIVRKPVNSFAQQVVEPGYRVESEELSDSEMEELEKWLKKAAIIEKEPDKDIHHMLKKAVIQREVRGTCLIEKVYAREKDDRLYGLAFMNAETVRPNTRPGKPILLMPNDHERLEDADGDNDLQLPMTEDGKTAAYTQYTTASGFGTSSPDNEKVNHFSMDDVIKLTRDADVNEAFGTSRVEAVSDTIEGLKQKMRDQNEAISSKAYPLWLFMFGSEEQPWDRDDINSFMNAHEMENFHPGLKQGVRGDVEIDTISGEVADVADYLQFDIDFIMSAMPLPKYALGSFVQKVNKQVAQSQERMVNQQIKEARRELESEFTGVLQQKAREKFDLSQEKADEVRFKIGRPGEEKEKQDPQTQTIDYKGKDSDKKDTSGSSDSDDGAQDPSTMDTDTQSRSSEENTVWDVDLTQTEARLSEADCEDGECSPEELADPRLVSTTDVEKDLMNLIEQVMVDFRDNTLSRVRSEYPDAPMSASYDFMGLANTRLNSVMRDNNLVDSSSVLMEEVTRRTLSTLQQENQPVTLEGAEWSMSHRQSTGTYAQNVRDSVRDALEELIHRMDRQLERGASNSEQLDTILQRIENSFDNGEIRQRAQLIARMEIQNAIENTKLAEFDKSDSVQGVKIINPCTEATTPLCSHLAGCGPRNGSVAKFDSSKTLSEQWEEQAPAGASFDNFDPIPAAPPFHFNCRSALIPLDSEDLEEELQQKPATNVEDLADKYGIEVDE